MVASSALRQWRSTGRARLRELEDVHLSVTGTRRGRLWGTTQLNRGLLVALVAQFQAYCRALHDQAIDVHEEAAVPAQRALVRSLLHQGRQLDFGNPRRSVLGADFGRFGFGFVDALKAEGGVTRAALDRLEELIDFRNAVTHGNESAIDEVLSDTTIRQTKRCFVEMLRTLDGLAGTMDRVVGSELAASLGISTPW